LAFRPKLLPAPLELRQRLYMQLLGLGRVAGAERPLLLAPLQNQDEVGRDSLSEPEDSGLWMLPGTSHRQDHASHPCVPLGQR
jgi:hypothetical protein